MHSPICSEPWTTVHYLSYVMQFYAHSLRDAPQSCRREDCRPKDAFLVGRLRPSGGCIIKTGSQRYCTKEGCSRNAFMYSTNIKPAKEVHFTSGLSSSVHLQGYMTELQADVSSWNSSGQRPVTAHLTALCVTKSLGWWCNWWGDF